MTTCRECGKEVDVDEIGKISPHLMPDGRFCPEVGSSIYDGPTANEGPDTVDSDVSTMSGCYELSRMRPLFESGEMSPSVWSTNIQQGTPLSLGLRMRMSGPATLNTDTLGSDIFHLRWWMVRRGTQVDKETGEVIDVLRTTLCDENGTTLSTTSMGIYDALCRLISFLPDGQITQPIPIRLRQITTTGRRRMLTFDLAQ